MEEFTPRIEEKKVCYKHFDDIMEIISEENKTLNRSSKGRNLYSRERMLKEDPVLGQYEVLNIYQFEDDGTKFRIASIAWTDEDGNILTLNDLNKINKHAMIMQHSDALEEKLRVRKIELEAMKDIKDEFQAVKMMKKKNNPTSLNELIK